MPDEYMISTSFTFDRVSLAKLKIIAGLEDRSWSWIVRDLVNKDFDKRGLILPVTEAQSAEPDQTDAGT